MILFLFGFLAYWGAASIYLSSSIVLKASASGCVGVLFLIICCYIFSSRSPYTSPTSENRYTSLAYSTPVFFFFLFTSNFPTFFTLLDIEKVTWKRVFGQYQGWLVLELF